ncbi:MAG: dihydrolipoamide acetyltransferase family protein [Actinomycetota bacterium]
MLRPAGPVLASPPVRKLAADLGVDLANVAGTGPRGNVTRQDIEAAAAAGRSAAPGAVAAPGVPGREAPGAEERIPVRGIRRAMAEKMARSAAEIPHVAEFLTIDATELLRLRQQLLAAEEDEGVRVTPLAIVVKALVTTLPKFPTMNACWGEDGKEIIVKHYYHVGVATDTERGLIVPVVRDAGRLSIFGIAREIARLVGATRDGTVGPGDLVGSTITVTNIGSFGVDTGTPIINYPEAAILAVGVIAPRPVVVGEEILPRQSVTLSCCFDHRIIDGATAGRFLRYLGDMLENPALLLGSL